MNALEQYPRPSHSASSSDNVNEAEEYAHVNHIKGRPCGTLSKSEWEAACKRFKRHILYCKCLWKNLFWFLDFSLDFPPFQHYIWYSPSKRWKRSSIAKVNRNSFKYSRRAVYFCGFFCKIRERWISVYFLNKEKIVFCSFGILDFPIITTLRGADDRKSTFLCCFIHHTC